MAGTPRHIVGLMSGTSCDGIDVALVRIEGTGPTLNAELLHFATFPYTINLSEKLQAMPDSLHDVVDLDQALGDLFAQAALRMIEWANERGITVDAIGSHGHTALHIPPHDGKKGSTLQIGSAARIAAQTRCTVFSDFRSADMAAGGHGAPLAPYVDGLLLRGDDLNTLCLNIGGIANVSLVRPDGSIAIAFDTGPGNMIIDGIVQRYTHGEDAFDADGARAAGGNVDDACLAAMLNHPYFDEAPPKSTGREMFGYAPYLSKFEPHWNRLMIDDAAATVTHAVATTIADACGRFIQPMWPIGRVALSGGGAKNATLMALLRERFDPAPVMETGDLGWPADAKEAVAFAILANECICGTPANVPAATGADRPVVLGNITPNPHPA